MIILPNKACAKKISEELLKFEFPDIFKLRDLIKMFKNETVRYCKFDLKRKKNIWDRNIEKLNSGKN